MHRQRNGGWLARLDASVNYMPRDSEIPRGFRLNNARVTHAIPSVTMVPMSVNHGQATLTLTAAPVAGVAFHSKRLTKIMTASEARVPNRTGRARALFQHKTSSKLPSNAPLVRPRRENAALSTYSTSRLR